MKRRPREPEPESGAPDSDVMTLKEVADYLHCHFMTVYKLIRTVELPAFRLGADWRFRRSDVDQWIAAGGGKPSGSAPAKSGGGRPGRKPKARARKS
jgi:excisionase family DNA binding protein